MLCINAVGQQIASQNSDLTTFPVIQMDTSGTSLDPAHSMPSNIVGERTTTSHSTRLGLAPDVNWLIVSTIVLVM